MWRRYVRPGGLPELLDVLAERGSEARLVAGGTDVVVELARAPRPDTTLIDLTALGELKYVREEDGWVRLGALATHNDVLASALCRERAWPLVQACREVGAPQIRTRATVAGNLVTASPANDTIAPLLALDAEVALLSRAGERVVPLGAFYTGFRRTVLRPDELLREIRFRPMGPDQCGVFVKLGLRRAQAISVIDFALVLTIEPERVGRAGPGSVREARIALGCLAPTVVRAEKTEAFLRGRRLDQETCRRAGEVAREDAAPISDVRGSAEYRLATLDGLLADALGRLARGEPDDGPPTVLLETDGGTRSPHPRGPHPSPLPARKRAPGEGTPEGVSTGAGSLSAVEVVVNGRRRALSAGRTLLDALREDAGLTGTKEGCAEGECGACTVWLNGQAVMACLTPAGQADGARVTTIEGLAGPGRLHRLQEAFVRHGAVQCGYCIPGFVMAGAKLLEEHPRPELAQVRVALSGNVCRCTGYRKILDAVLAAR
ncbi:MAG TPA: FAD binding domain-containing protein [Chloroflexota bacterium]|nr:FAD binding domain-containing protein [Chloroflexota bacterium]